MNRVRIAALFRELAEEFERDDDVAAGSRPRAKGARRLRQLTRPDGEATPEVVALARRALSTRGFR